MHNKNGAHMLVGEVELLRLCTATAESAMKALREQARDARHRQKEAKRFARHARKQFKRSKAETARLRKALAEAETRLFRSGGRALTAKLAKANRVAKSKHPVRRRSSQATKPKPASGTVVVSRRAARKAPPVRHTDSTLETPRLRFFPQIGSLHTSNQHHETHDL